MGLITISILIVAVLLIGYMLGSSGVEVIEIDCIEQDTDYKGYSVVSCTTLYKECIKALSDMES